MNWCRGVINFYGLYDIIFCCIGVMNVVELEYELVFDYEGEGVVFDYEVWFEFDDIDDWDKDKSMFKRSVRVGS